MKQMKGLFWLTLVSLFCVAGAVPEKSLQVVPSAAVVEFLAVGRPSMLKIRGSSRSGLKGTVTAKGDAVNGSFMLARIHS